MSASAQGRIHAGLAVLWLGASVPICVYLLTSVPFLVFISVYAVVVGHWSGWQAARADANSPDA